MGKLQIDNYQEKIDLPAKEHDVLSFWDETDAFTKSVEGKSAEKRYVFYDGPPFATGTPHYGHILASTIKDVVPRYWTMKGYRVDRVWGWDCHGIPIENMIEKELDLKGGKKGIEELGIDKFNNACRTAILRFDKEWEKVIRRIGRWVDFKHSYKTMDKPYMESVWWAFKTMYEKGLTYEGRRVILYCPRCATPLSNFEIAMDNSYKDVEDNSVYVLFKVKGAENEYIAAWTTTPWTLIGNVAVAVDEAATYERVEFDGKSIWVAQKRKEAVFKNASPTVLETATGVQLVGKEYESLYGYMPLDGKKAHYVAAASFVSLDDGTGIVHTAAIYGEDDYALAQKLDLPCVPTLDDQGKFLDFVEPLKGVFYKKSEDWVIEDLKKRNLLLRAEKFVHSYPFCYRCGTPLYFNAVPAWFINVQKMKPAMVSENEHINWYPDHLKYGRFGKGLETAPDWNISRSRYWGTPMPIWRNGKEAMRVIGSIEELKTWAVDPKQVEHLTDIHREFLDDIEVWVDDAKTMKGKRIPDVFDCWVESGSMPYASIHYPFENKELFEATHPAQFIAEYIAQTRAWFYTLHVMSVGLFEKNTFENAVTTGTILAEDGTKMSKSKKNYPDPSLVFEKYGVDALRFYLMSSVVMKAENLNFSEEQVKEVYQKIVSIIWNVFSFYKLYVNTAPPETISAPTNDLDQWIVSKTNRLIAEVTVLMDAYDMVGSCRHITDFIADLSTWYLRRSRDRLKDSAEAADVFGWTLLNLVKVMAPFTPFISELVYQNLTNSGSSVHLESWPVADMASIQDVLESEMIVARSVVEAAHAQRKEHSVKVRQPLASLTYTGHTRLRAGVEAIIAEETNVKRVEFETYPEKDSALVVTLDFTLTDELKAEGEAREVMRNIQILRKETKCAVDDRISLTLPLVHKHLSKALLDTIQKETLADSLTWGETLSISTG